MPTLMERLKSSLSDLESNYYQARHGMAFGIGLILVGIFIVYLGSSFVSGWLIAAPVLSGILMLYLGVSLFQQSGRVIAEFNHRLDQSIFPQVAGLYGLMANTEQLDPGIFSFKRGRFSTLVNTSDNYSTQLIASELITEPHNKIMKDDVLIIKIEDKELFVQELKVSNVTGSGKNRRERHIFTGYFVVYSLSTILNGKTFISTEGDKDGFGHQTFWTNLVGDGVEKTELEWNDFEKKLHVSTNDPVEARYILTPDFMSDLYQWWNDKHDNIRLSFIGDRMCLLFPTKLIRIGYTISKLSETEIQSYIESIALPLLHVLHLVEDVQDRFPSAR